MSKTFPKIEAPHRAFIEAQHMFFVATAAPDGRVNLSPKGRDSLRVLDENRLIWLNLTGSGNETAGHLLQHPRMTLMWCSFSKRPMIYRAYGTARTIHATDPDWSDLLAHFPTQAGARQIYDVTIDMTQTSCGYAVPFMDFAADRDTLAKWAEDRGEDGVRAYWAENNQTTLDGAPTGVPVDEPSA